MFFKVIVLDGPLGKVKYHAIRIEFQVRGSPHVHSLLWIIDAPVLSPDTLDEYVQFIDGIIKTCVPDVNKDPTLYDLVTTYQVHMHSKSCRKYKNQMCRYNFGKFFTDRTIVSVPLPSDTCDQERKEILENRHRVLSKVKQYIDDNLNPKKRNILNPKKKNLNKYQL